jgi:hypothetical protein
VVILKPAFFPPFLEKKYIERGIVKIRLFWFFRLWHLVTTVTNHKTWICRNTAVRTSTQQNNIHLLHYST